MESAAGLTVVALFVLWFGYVVPQMIQHRVALVEARVEDRNSGGLRVVAVSGRTRRRGGAMTNGTHSRPTPSSDTETPARRRALAERRSRRAVRARRRLVVTSVVLVATVAAWACVATDLVHWAVAVCPTTLLVALLVAGRRAAVRARRAQEAVDSARRAAQRRATQARALANGGPYAPRNRLRLSDDSSRAGGVLDEIMTVPEPAPAKIVDESGAPAIEGADDESAPAEQGVGGGAWDPVPVPLPTYVTKARAPRLPAAPSARTEGVASVDVGGSGEVVTATDGVAPAGPSGSGVAGGRTGDPRADAAPGRSASDDSAARLAAAVRASAGISSGEASTVDTGDRPDETPGAGEVPTAEAAGPSSATGTHPDEEELMRPAPRVRDETLAQPLEQILARRRAAG